MLEDLVFIPVGLFYLVTTVGESQHLESVCVFARFPKAQQLLLFYLPTRSCSQLMIFISSASSGCMVYVEYSNDMNINLDRCCRITPWMSAYLGSLGYIKLVILHLHGVPYMLLMSFCVSKLCYFVQKQVLVC